MKLVLDTNALWHAELMEVLGAWRLQGDRAAVPPGVILPSVSYVERARQIHGDQPREEAWARLLARVGPAIEPFTATEADRVAARRPSQDAWDQHGRDFLIAAHVHGERVGVTSDAGPAWQGVRKLTPDKATELVDALVG